jgi:putative transposase
MRFGSISGFPSAYEWSRTCWRRAGSSSPMKPCGAGRRNLDGSTRGKIRRRAPQFGDTWDLDEVVISINGKKHWLWRAVDADGFVLDASVQSRGDRRAAEKLLRKLNRKQSRAPRVMITDRLGSYGAAGRECT